MKHQWILSPIGEARCGRCGRYVRNRDLIDIASLFDCFDPQPAPVVERTAVPTRSVGVSIIVTGRNVGQWLAECLWSCKTQSVPCEVIYSDDASIDDSLRIAMSQEVLIVESAVHLGPCEARNRGARIARGEFLLFVDADDVLTPTFVEDHLAAMRPGVPFVYGPAKAFGEGPSAGTLWTVPPWDAWDRWMTNTVNTSALYRASAFWAAGGWLDRVPTMWDWDLALRVARHAEASPAPSKALLMYRQHGQSWSASVDEKHTSSLRSECLAAIRRANARLSVCCLWSGRIPDLRETWADRLAASVRFAELSNPVDLVILGHNSNKVQLLTLRQEFRRYRETFSAIRVEPFAYPLEWDSEADRRDQVAGMLAVAYQAMRDRAQGDVLLFVEDDILIPRPGVRRLWQALTEGHQPPHAVSGVYRNRHVPEQFVGGFLTPQGINEAWACPTDGKAFPVDFTGTGCLMTWANRPAIPKAWRSHENGAAAHDWAYTRDITRAGGSLLMHPDVRCDHVQSLTEVLAV